LILLLLSDNKSHRLAAVNFHDDLGSPDEESLPRANHGSA